MRKRKKIWIIIAAAVLVIAAVAGLHFLPAQRREQGQGGGDPTSYTPIEDTSLPVAYMEISGRQMNRLCGFTQDQPEAAGRGSLAALPSDRKLTVYFYNLDSPITGIQYDIRSLEDNSLVERTVVDSWHQDDGSAEAVTILPIQNLISKEQEYQLTLAIATENQPSLYYYTRIVWTDNTFLPDMFALAENFSENTFHYENVSDLTTYLETDPTVDNSSLGRVTLKNSFSQITWGGLGIQRTGDVEIELLEMQGIMATVRLSYVASDEESAAAAGPGGSSDGQDSAGSETQGSGGGTAGSEVQGSGNGTAGSEAQGGGNGTAGSEAESSENGTAARGAGGNLYDVSETFTMRWNAQRIYMMDYERRVNQVFSGASSLYAGKRIMLGISDGLDLQSVSDAAGNFDAFVVSQELWLYDRQKNENTRVFSLRTGEGGEAGLPESAGLRILSVSDNGEVDFLVSGYMGRGSHEGSAGVAAWRYEAESNRLTEQLYLPAASSSQELQMSTDTLSYLSNGTLYLMVGSSVCSVDMETRQVRTIASGLTEKNFSVSAGKDRIAWQTQEDRETGKTVRVMDLKTGREDRVQAPEGKQISLLGFVGSDLVYGLSDDSGDVTVNGRPAQMPMYAVEIVGEDMQVQIRYEKEGIWISDVEIQDSRLHLERLSQSGSSFTSSGTDTLVCNDEAGADSLEGIGYLASQDRGRVYFVQLDENVPGGQVQMKVPELAAAEADPAVQGQEEEPVRERQYYAYSQGRLRGIYSDFKEAVDAVYEGMGIVTDERDLVFWARADRETAASVRDVQSLVSDVDRYLAGFSEGEVFTDDGGAMIDASGLTLNQVLYFVYRGYPVAAYTGDGSYVLICGYDQYNITLMRNPAADPSATEKMGLNDAQAYFDANGAASFVAFLFQK